MTSSRSHVAVVAILAALLGGCGQKSAEPTAMPVVAAPAAPSTAQPQRPAAEPTVPKPFVVSAPMALPGPAPAPPSAQEFTNAPALKDVLFGPGSTDVDPNSAPIIRSNARWILDNGDYLILIEGYSDYKGTRESNLAAG